MKFVRAYNFSNNDCTMDTVCEHCGNIDVDKYAYIDSNYRENVIPSRYCSKCKKNREGLVYSIPATSIKLEFDNISRALHTLSVHLIEDITPNGIDKQYLLDKYQSDIENTVKHIKGQLKKKVI